MLRAGPSLPYVQIANHLRAAEQIGEWLSTAESAALVAHDSGDSALASELLLELIDEPTISTEQVNRVALALGKSALGMVGERGMITVLGQLLEDPRLTSATRAELRFQRGLLSLRRSGSLDAGREDLEEAVAQLADSNPASALMGMSVLAVAQFGETPASEAQRWLPLVEKGIQRSADPAVRASAAANQLHTLIQLGDPAGLPQALELPDRSDDSEERRALTRAHANVADACGWVGHFSSAVASCGPARSWPAPAAQSRTSAASPTPPRRIWTGGRVGGRASPSAASSSWTATWTCRSSPTSCPWCSRRWPSRPASGTRHWTGSTARPPQRHRVLRPDGHFRGRCPHAPLPVP
ncbi:hypothetical protein [Fodinicola feengrottensis]|uniref:hypothetical protein n=1 Tax=Fodinicola feengrottensis TaxID=435914 RepID=UPI002441D3C0|nr:hypothetical protein [Fodinicola feengrottensis]